MTKNCGEEKKRERGIRERERREIRTKRERKKVGRRGSEERHSDAEREKKKGGWGEGERVESEKQRQTCKHALYLSFFINMFISILFIVNFTHKHIEFSFLIL